MRMPITYFSRLVEHIKVARQLKKSKPSPAPSILDQLIEAKKRSDYQDYDTKTKILADLLRKHPNDFKVDSELNQKYVGITHKPTGFKIHAPRKIVPRNIENTIKKTR